MSITAVRTATLLSIQVTKPRSYGTEDASDPMDRSWTSGIAKQPVDGPLWLGRTNLAGDGQADLVHHGGPDRAVLVYGASHYPEWRRELDWPDLPHGAFGENFTVSELTGDTVCIGDSYALGDAVIQVSQPRQPCWKLAWRWRMKELTALVEQTGRTGWYVRVLQEADVQAGLPLTLLERPCPEWSIRRVAEVMRHRQKQHEAAGALAGVEYLSMGWREHLAEAAAGR